jgi:hypothetical protein
MAAVVGLAAVLSIVSCDDRNRLWVPGDVKDVEGRPIEGCKVELVVQTPVFSNWSGTIAREALTDSAGRFSFSEFVVHESTYRLRIKHPGYQEWLIDGKWPGSPRRYHITLLRHEPVTDRVPQS